MLRRALFTIALVAAPATAFADAAQDHYSAGRDAYRGGLYGRALEEFERSFVASESPNTHLYIARSLRELGRWAEAATHFRATIHEAEERGAKYAQAREAAVIELRDVEVRLERAEPPKNETQTREPPRAPAPAPAPVIAPEHASMHPTTTTWVSGGVAALGLASFSALYLLAGDRHAYLEGHCTQTRDAACDDALSTGRTEETAAFVGLGVAVVAAGVAIVSLVLSPRTNDRPNARRPPWVVAF